METAAVNTDWIPLLCVLVFTIAFSLGKQTSVTEKTRQTKTNVSKLEKNRFELFFHIPSDGNFLIKFSLKKLIVQLNFMFNDVQ